MTSSRDYKQRWLGSALGPAGAGGLSLLCAVMTPVAAFAAGDDAKEATVETVYVTAQKRSENIQDTPLAIQAVSEAAIATLGASTLRDIERAAPGVTFGDGSAFGRAGVRGIVDYSRNAAYDARVGVYVDGVFMSRSHMNNVELLDVDRVEILRGPQGTLFGKNTDAGVINIVTHKPNGVFAGKATAEAGSFGYGKLAGYVNLPIDEDRVALSLGLSKSQSDGFLQNLQLHTRSQAINHLAGRAQLRFRPNEAWDINLSIDAQQQLDRTTHYIADPAPGADPFEFRSPNADNERTRSRGATATIQYSADSGFTFMNITDYRLGKFRKFFNGQGGKVDYFSGQYIEDVDQISEELRLISPKAEKFDYVAGLYYFNMKVNQFNYLAGGPDLPAAGFGAYVGKITPTVADVETKSYAAYINGNWRPIDRLELSAGLRYTVEEKSILFSMGDPVGLLFANLTGYRDNRTDKKLSPKVSANFKITDDAMIYAAYARGFKAGGWAADFVNVNQVRNGLRVDSEDADSFELGLKSDWFNHRARVNLTTFLEKFDKYQVFQLASAIVEGREVRQTSLTNAGKVTSKGVELEASVLPTETLTISLNGAYTDSKYDTFPGGGGTFNGTVLNADGVPLQYAPKWKGYLSADLDQPAFSWANVIAHVGISAQSRSNSDSKVANPGLAYIYRLPGYTVVDARLGLRATEGEWEVSLWGRNLLDQKYIRFTSVPTLGSFRISRYGDPRMYGVTLRTGF